MAAQITERARASHAARAARPLPRAGILYAGEAPAHVPDEGIDGVSLTLDCGAVAEAQQVIDAPAAGGREVIAMLPAFRAKARGMLVDRSGLPWIVNGESLPM